MISFPTVSLFRWCNLFHFRRVAMMRNLLAPYEQRPWAQTNWILVRLWRVRDAEKRKNTETERGESTFTLSFFLYSYVCVCVCCQGCGFGYRYTRLPHLLKTKPEDMNLPSLQSMFVCSLSNFLFSIWTMVVGFDISTALLWLVQSRVPHCCCRDTWRSYWTRTKKWLLRFLTVSSTS